MDRQVQSLSAPGQELVNGGAAPKASDSPIWYVVAIGLIAWQGWMTLTLFGPDHPWQRLCDDQPIISGRHALHLYHGMLGAQSLRERGRLSCYDPAFQAGYPKTPIFDSGSRPAELFLSVAGGSYRPAAYKIGLAICCCLVPVLLLLASRGFGLARGLSCGATAIGQLVWWSGPGRTLLEAGDLDLAMGALAGLVCIAWLVRFDQTPDFVSWLVLLFGGCLGWFSQPIFSALILPLYLIYYLSVGARHRLGWHFALLGALIGALTVNSFWLIDWASYWWIRLPLRPWDNITWTRQFWQQVWSAGLWGDRADRALILFLLVGGALGVWILNETKQRAAARLVGLGTAGFLVLAVASLVASAPGASWLGGEQLLVPALWFATLPAVHAGGMAIQFVERLAGNPARGAVVGCWLVVVVMVGGRHYLSPWAARCLHSSPLQIGLSQDDQTVLETLRTQTSPEARILWEDQVGPRQDPHWTPLLPLLTGRDFLGGLDPESGIEHSYASFIDQSLAGRPIREWTDAELDPFCHRYNVGWVVCRSPAAVERFRNWKGETASIPLADGRQGWLFTLGPRSFFVKGKGRLLSADSRRIILADVVPENGRVVLSFHYQNGFQASPSRVLVERETDPYDPIPLIRIQVPGPVARLTLTWEDP
jgi:hypothetical protein